MLKATVLFFSSMGMKWRAVAHELTRTILATGIFLSSGASIATAGPGGALVSYLIVSIMVYFIVMSLGEMSALIPGKALTALAFSFLFFLFNSIERAKHDSTL